MTKPGFTRPDPLNLGFTGTQVGATVKQLRTLFWLLTEDVLRLPDRFHLGDCIGADEQAAHLAHALGIDCVGHPPSDGGRQAHFERYLVSYEPLPYLARNRELVDVCDALIACSRTMKEELRSGTWATVRYALKKRKPVWLIVPNGVLRRLP